VNRHPAPARAVRPIAPDFSEVEDTTAAPVAEVIVSYAGTMLDVRHVAPRAKRSKDRVGALVGLGAATLVAGLALFAHEVAQDWDEHREAAMVAVDEGRVAPEPPGLGLGGWGALLGMLGLVPLAIGLLRMSDRRPTAYTLGERTGATFHTVLDVPTVDAVLPLVASGRLGFTAGMTGEIATAGSRYTLHDLVEDGRARTEGSYFSVRLPPDARCRLAYGPLTFHVNAVAPGRVVAGRRETDKPFWASNAVSLVMLGGLLALAHLALGEADAMDLDDNVAVNRYVGYITQPDRVQHDDVDGRPDGDDLDASQALAGTTEGARAELDEGTAGDPKAKAAHGRAQIQRRSARPAPPQFARNHDPIRSAEEAGILGQMKSDSSHYFAQAGNAFAVGVDDRDVWSLDDGTEIGEAFGEVGGGLRGNGRGGGGDGQGIGLGDMGLIGHARSGEGGDGVRRASGMTYDHGGTRLGTRSRRVPAVRIAKAATVCGGAACLDKEVIRRVVRSHINEVRHCYNQGLVRDPNLQGRVSIQFRIDARGSVPASVVGTSTLDAPAVERCIASAVKRWRFPAAPGRMGSVLVTYPFVLSPG
jgi:hypothetical protein